LERRKLPAQLSLGESIFPPIRYRLFWGCGCFHFVLDGMVCPDLRFYDLFDGWCSEQVSDDHVFWLTLGYPSLLLVFSSLAIQPISGTFRPSGLEDLPVSFMPLPKQISPELRRRKALVLPLKKYDIIRRPGFI